MKIYFLIFHIFLFMSHLYADELKRDFKVDTFEQAEKSPEYIRFNMKSTKAGMITTNFHGYAKSYSLKANFNKEYFALDNLTLKTNQLDTDNSSRNEKMLDDCFRANESSRIIIKTKAKIPINKQIEFAANIKVFEDEKPLSIKAMIIKDQGHYFIEGNARVGLKELEIPDPSIWIASVDDQVEIIFKIKLIPVTTIN